MSLSSALHRIALDFSAAEERTPCPLSLSRRCRRRAARISQANLSRSATRRIFIICTSRRCHAPAIIAAERNRFPVSTTTCWTSFLAVLTTPELYSRERSSGCDAQATRQSHCPSRLRNDQQESGERRRRRSDMSESALFIATLQIQAHGDQFARLEIRTQASPRTTKQRTPNT